MRGLYIDVSLVCNKTNGYQEYMLYNNVKRNNTTSYNYSSTTSIVNNYTGNGILNVTTGKVGVVHDKSHINVTWSKLNYDVMTNVSERGSDPQT